MDSKLVSCNLTGFQKFVLARIIPFIDEKTDFVLYDLIKSAIAHKDISSSTEDLIMETYAAIDHCLTTQQIISEKKERRVYCLNEPTERLQSLDLQD